MDRILFAVCHVSGFALPVLIDCDDDVPEFFLPYGNGTRKIIVH